MRGRVTMTPRMITIMVHLPDQYTDDAVACLFGYVIKMWGLTPTGADLAAARDSFLIDCKTLPENEDRFFRENSFKEKPE